MTTESRAVLRKLASEYNAANDQAHSYLEMFAFVLTVIFEIVLIVAVWWL